MPESIDLLVFEIEKDNNFGDLLDGDFVVRSHDPKIKKFMRWLCG